MSKEEKTPKAKIRLKDRVSDEDARQAVGGGRHGSCAGCGKYSTMLSADALCPTCRCNADREAN